jgi:arylsulfatase A-like enzyme
MFTIRFFSIIIALFLYGCSRKGPTVFEPITIPEGVQTNVLLIVAENIGTDAFPGYEIGTNKPTLPNLEKMASQGVTFANTWSYPTGTYTQASILTGKYGSKTGALKSNAVQSESIGLQESLHKHVRRESNDAYENAFIGKWSLSTNAIVTSTMGIRYYSGFFGEIVPNPYDWTYTARVDGRWYDTPRDVYITNSLTYVASNWIGQQNAPWFLLLRYTSAGAPFHVPPDSTHTQGALSEDANAISQKPMPYYFAMLENLDHEIGRLLQEIPDSVLQYTTVIFVGENGADQDVLQAPYTQGQGKGTLYQGGIHVPMIVSGAHVQRVGQQDTNLVQSTDLFATIAQLTGTLSSSNYENSYSFRELLEAPGTGSRKYNYSENGGVDSVAGYAIRNMQYKLIEYTDGTRELYDLQSDPYEQNNLMLQNRSSEVEQQLQELVTEAQKIQE